MAVGCKVVSRPTLTGAGADYTEDEWKSAPIQFSRLMSGGIAAIVRGTVNFSADVKSVLVQYAGETRNQVWSL